VLPHSYFRLVLMPMSLKITVPRAVNLTVAVYRLLACWAPVPEAAVDEDGNPSLRSFWGQC